jgi:hypothetical protein
VACTLLASVLVAGIATDSATVAAVSRPTTKTSVQTGVNVQFYDWGYPSSIVTNDAKRVLFYVKALGANTVAITIPFELPSLTGNTIQVAPFTPSASAVGTVVKIAVGDKLNVILRPLVDETNIRPGWRGEFVPSDPSTWFTNYLKFLRPYLQMAQKDKVTSFDLASELQGTYSLSGWGGAISLARALFKGKMIISGAWQGTTKSFSGVTLGIDAYAPVSTTPAASVATLLAGWNKNLKGVAFPAADSSTIITEVAIPAQDGAYLDPSSYDIGNKVKVNGAIQANWFEAACKFVQQHKIAGLFFWRLDLNFSPTTAPSSGSPLWFSAAAVKEIKSCFKTLK